MYLHQKYVPHQHLKYSILTYSGELQLASWVNLSSILFYVQILYNQGLRRSTSVCNNPPYLKFELYVILRHLHACITEINLFIYIPGIYTTPKTNKMWLKNTVIEMQSRINWKRSCFIRLHMGPNNLCYVTSHFLFFAYIPMSLFIRPWRYFLQFLKKGYIGLYTF